MTTQVGAVVIGRNEGERLRRCLETVVGSVRQAVYVDSGSTDNSANMARSLGVEVVDLDLTQPFTAARARNAGFSRLLELAPDIDFVQFVDGDCQVVGDWLMTAKDFLVDHDNVAVVCGRRRELYPERSIYNLFCDIEWDTPVGEAKACGGDAMMRVNAFNEAGGYRSDCIAGEEPELCVRLRFNGWRVFRLDAEMTLHDAAMTRFSQWWKRCMRTGYAYAQGVAIHGAPPERHWVPELRRSWLWGGLMPMLALSAAILLWPWGVIALLIFPAQIFRLAVRGKRTRRENGLYALCLVMGKIPEMIGVLSFSVKRALGRQARLIEYK